MRKKWDEAGLRKVAANYDRKIDFRRADHAAYIAMQKRFPHLLNECFPHRPTKYTEEIVTQLAAEFDSLKAFERGDRAGSEALHIYYPHLKDVLFDRKIKPANYWTHERLTDVASNYRTKEDFYRGNLGAYSSAVRLGVLDALGFESGASCDNDALYIWQAVDQYFNGKPVYKIGVTSLRLGTSRIKRVARWVRRGERISSNGQSRAFKCAVNCS